MTRLAEKSANALSLYLLVSLSIAGWSANAGIKAMFDALNVLRRTGEALFHQAQSPVADRHCIGDPAADPHSLHRGHPPCPPVVDAVSDGPRADRLVVRWPAFFAIAIIALGILYKVGPSRRAPRFVWVLPGASVAALAWVGASYLFGWYVSTLSDYTATYGSLAALSCS